jgi:hypothetical protein
MVDRRLNVRSESLAQELTRIHNAALSSSLAPGIHVEQVRELSKSWRKKSTEHEAEARSAIWPSDMGRHGLRKKSYTLTECADDLDALITSASAQGAASGPSLLDALHALLDDQPLPDGTYVHHLTCNASHREPVGNAMCSCPLWKRIRAASVFPPAPQWRPIAESVRKFADELLESGRRDFVNCEPSEWWTPDRMKTLAYGRSMLMVSIAGSLHAILKADPPASSSPTASAKGK